MDVNVSEAHDGDAPLIAEITRKAWEGRCPPTSHGHLESADKVLNDLREGGAFILWVGNHRLGVLPEYAGQNLSQYLIEACVNRARLSDIAELRLFLNPWMESMSHMYEAYGFEPAPEIEFTLRNPNEAPPIMMRKSLEY